MGSQMQPIPIEPTISVGSRVRLYYEMDIFDEGEVTSIAPGQIDVDFYDWIERWTSSAQFGSTYLWIEAIDVFVPLEAGTVIVAFKSG